MSLIDLRLVYAQAQAPQQPMTEDPMAAMGADPMGMGGDPAMGGGDPMAAMGGAGGAPPGGMDMGMGGGGEGTAEMANPQGADRQEIGGPLNEVALVLHDFDIQQKVETTGKDPAKLAQEIWIAYGGDKTGGVVPGRVGQRDPDQNVPEDQIEAERQSTEDTRWDRLPRGLNIAQVILGSDDPQDKADPQEAFNTLEKLCQGMLISSAQSLNPVYQKVYGPAAGGGMPTASVKYWYKLASKYDRGNKLRSADLVDRMLAAYLV